MKGELLLFLGAVFSTGLAWGMGPLLSPTPYNEKSRFSLSDMYALVLQLSLAGFAVSRRWQNGEDGRFFVALISLAAVLALIWGCILSALNERGVKSSLRRFAVFLFAPLNILCCLAAPFVFSMRDFFVPLKWQSVALLLLCACVPPAARVVFSWAVRQNAGDSTP